MKIWKTLVIEFIIQNRKNLLHWVFDKKSTLWLCRWNVMRVESSKGKNKVYINKFCMRYYKF